jgi:vacuolar-type H+-ATPase subunit E/Vma4
LDKTFDKLEAETKARQQHAINMAQIDGASNLELLQMKKQYLDEMLELYKKYAKDTKDIKYSITETAREFEIAIPPHIRME